MLWHTLIHSQYSIFFFQQIKKLGLWEFKNHEQEHTDRGAATSVSSKPSVYNGCQE